jgi:hypothetical protein
MIGSKSFDRLAYTVVIATTVFCCRSVDQLVMHYCFFLFQNFNPRGADVTINMQLLEKRTLAQIFYALSIL